MLVKYSYASRKVVTLTHSEKHELQHFQYNALGSVRQSVRPTVCLSVCALLLGPFDLRP